MSTNNRKKTTTYTNDYINVSSMDDFTCITISTEDVFNSITKNIANDMMEKGTRKSELNRVFQSKMHGSLISAGHNAGIDYMKERAQKENKDI